VATADASDLRPSADTFGATLGVTIRCDACGHTSLEVPPSEEVLAESYGDTADPVSLREETGQVETGRRTLAHAERFVAPGRFLDLGCWTGSLLVAARERGWDAVGVEPSTWASARARARGADVVTAPWQQHSQAAGSFELVAMCDVIEHLIVPGAALDEIARLLAPGGAVLLTLPDAGSRLARVLGRRWWSVLPMHVQYFTRASLTRLLHDHGFDVRVVQTHAKVFSARYYVERLAGYSAALDRVGQALLRRVGQSERLVAPDFRDRMLVIATRS
jgi:SAM-dependent methyltransferase